MIDRRRCAVPTPSARRPRASCMYSAEEDRGAEHRDAHAGAGDHGQGQRPVAEQVQRDHPLVGALSPRATATDQHDDRRRPAAALFQRRPSRTARPRARPRPAASLTPDAMSNAPSVVDPDYLARRPGEQPQRALQHDHRATTASCSADVERSSASPALSVMTPPSSGPPTSRFHITPPMIPTYRPRSRGLMMSVITTIAQRHHAAGGHALRPRCAMSMPVSCERPATADDAHEGHQATSISALRSTRSASLPHSGCSTVHRQQRRR